MLCFVLLKSFLCRANRPLPHGLANSFKAHSASGKQPVVQGRAAVPKRVGALKRPPQERFSHHTTPTRSRHNCIVRGRLADRILITTLVRSTSTPGIPSVQLLTRSIVRLMLSVIRLTLCTSSPSDTYLGPRGVEGGGDNMSCWCVRMEYARALRARDA